MGHAEQYDQARNVEPADHLTFDGDARPGRSLQNGTHEQRLSAWFNSRMPSRRDVFAQRPLMVNLGSGPTGPESWVNLDRSPTMLLRHAPLVARALRRPA